MEKFTAGTPSSEWTIPVWIGLPLYEHLLLKIFILKIKVIHVFVNISYRIVQESGSYASSCLISVLMFICMFKSCLKQCLPKPRRRFLAFKQMTLDHIQLADEQAIYTPGPFNLSRTHGTETDQGRRSPLASALLHTQFM